MSELKIPQHISIIMDGNNRWAKANNVKTVQGHRQGIKTASEIIETCIELGVPYLTLYTFSYENWKRPDSEVRDLMLLLEWYLDRELDNLHQRRIKIRIIGELSLLAANIKKKLIYCQELTTHNDGLVLTVALSYGGREEILSATRSISRMVAEGKLCIDDITQDCFAKYLYTKDIPDPDLMIRTGGYQRVSNFLLWQSAYTELIFSPVMWPDFDKHHLLRSIEEFSHVSRNYGMRRVDS